MAWHIEDSGFAMTLDARLPARIRQWFRSSEELSKPDGDPAKMLWAVHPGGRLILNSVQEACGLSDEQMHPSREVLRRFGNMSSASIMFILRDLLGAKADEARPGRAIGFGPGLTVEVMDFTLQPSLTNAPHSVIAEETIGVTLRARMIANSVAGVRARIARSTVCF
jgi:predicted naringenin-chalcone synthase